MRSSTVLTIAAAAAMTIAPAIAGAAPLRAGAALPTGSTIDAGVARRAATPVRQQSDLAGFPVLGFVGIFVAIVVIVVVASSGGGRSPG